ncbi:MAG: competence/damage-inducible protein A [Gammaproteobacteria bacterium]|nr:competence/damage-inducible protein A [Gammaproteobacteria bacterium]
MKIGLILVGDEILSGRRVDRHMPRVVEMLRTRGLCLSWVRILGDEPEALVACYRSTFASSDLVFSTGGIGATPDDLTRAAVAQALGRPTERHPQGVTLLQKFARETGRELTPERYRLVEFPRGAELIPNPYNGIPGFRIDHHHFVPGFPEMAWPMLEWVLDNLYPDLQDAQYSESSLLVYGANESRIIPLMEAVMGQYPGVRLFSLPILESPPRIELGAKGPLLEVKAAIAAIKARLSSMGVDWQRQD